MELSLVSKQSHNIICNEPRNKNKIIPVFEVSGSCLRKFSQNMQGHFLNKKIKNKLQRLSDYEVQGSRQVCPQ